MPPEHDSPSPWSVTRDFLKDLPKDPIRGVATVLLLLGLVMLVANSLTLSSDAPFLTGAKNPLDDWRLTLIAVLFIGLSVAMLRKPVREEGGSDPAPPEGIDIDAWKAIFHGNHKTNLAESAFEHSLVSATAVIDRHGNYYGMYEREGRVVSPQGADGLVVHVSASGASLSFEDLKVTAFDLQEGVSLESSLLEETYRCKIFKIFFHTPKVQGRPFHVRWLFRWPRSMNPRKDGDVLNLQRFAYPPARAHLSLQLPAPPQVLRGFSVNGEGLRYRPAQQQTEARRGLYQGTLGIDDTQSLDCLGLLYQIDRPQEELPELFELTEIRHVKTTDLQDIALLEKKVEGRHSASRSVLESRLFMFPAGFLVACLGDVIVGYIESCRWNYEMISTFATVSDFAKEHRPEGRFLYVIFMAVAPPFRNQGIASKLLAAILDLAERSGVEEVQLVSEPDTRPLYSRAGFESVKELPAFVPGKTGILMKKKIVPGSSAAGRA